MLTLGQQAVDGFPETFSIVVFGLAILSAMTDTVDMENTATNNETGNETMTTQAKPLTLTITAILPGSWYAGMLMDRFEFSDGTTGRCNCILYRNRMPSTSVTIYGHGPNGSCFSTMPIGWSAQVGDTITVHPNQLTVQPLRSIRVVS